MIYNFLSYATFSLIVNKKMPGMELNSTFCRDNIGTMALPYKWKTVRKHFLNCADCMILSVSSKSRYCGYHTSTVVPCRGSLRSNASPGLATCQQCNVFLHIHFILRAAIRPIFIHLRSLWKHSHHWSYNSAWPLWLASAIKNWLFRNASSLFTQR